MLRRDDPSPLPEQPLHGGLHTRPSLPEAVRAKMRLIHYPDFHDVDGSPIACAREGDRWEL